MKIINCFSGKFIRPLWPAFFVMYISDNLPDFAKNVFTSLILSDKINYVRRIFTNNQRYLELNAKLSTYQLF